MKNLFLLTIVSIIFGLNTRFLRWKPFLALAAVVSAMVLYQWFNIVFKHIDVE